MCPTLARLESQYTPSILVALVVQGGPAPLFEQSLYWPTFAVGGGVCQNAVRQAQLYSYAIMTTTMIMPLKCSAKCWLLEVI